MAAKENPDMDKIPDTQDTFEYDCRVCGFHNVWTRAEILRKGSADIYLGEGGLDVYALACKRPDWRCTGKHKVGLPKE